MPLASNQIQYSLLYRVPEGNGVIEACNEAAATVIAYSPLAQGLLTGTCATRVFVSRTVKLGCRINTTRTLTQPRSWP